MGFKSNPYVLLHTADTRRCLKINYVNPEPAIIKLLSMWIQRGLKLDGKGIHKKMCVPNKTGGMY